MPFPESDRVRYGKNPLVEVICELRFCNEIEIGKGQIGKVFEVLGKEFPMIQIIKSSDINVKNSDGEDVFSDSTIEFKSKTVTSYIFSNQSSKCRITINSSYVSITAEKYESWEEFRSIIEKSLKCMKDTLSVSQFKRVGLRYVNVIAKERLGLAGVPWKELLKPFVAGILNADFINEDEIAGRIETFGLKLKDTAGFITLKHGIVVNSESGERGYLIDSDFFLEEERNVEDAMVAFDGFSKRAGKVFRGCINEKLHGAMEPSPV